MVDRPQVIIRAAEPEDYIELAEAFKGKRLQAQTLQLPYPSRRLWKNRLENPREGFYYLVAVVEGKVVGSAGLEVHPGRRRHSADLGIGLHDDYQGRGIGTALMAALIDLAENWLGLTRIELTVYADNAPAIALYRKFKFDVEGTLRRYALRNGEYVDVLAMARLHD